MTCLHCTAETSNGLALCERCQIAGSVVCEYLPIHFANLARWRPGRAGARPVPGSRVLYDGTPPDRGNDRVVRALDEVSNTVTTWARCLHDDRGVDLPGGDDEADVVTAACRTFAKHLTSIATLEWAGTFLTELADAERRLSRLAEQVVPGWYAGACRHCGVSTYVVPGLTWVKCGGCGAATYARDHLEVVIEEARGWVARPKALAEALVALLDSEQSVPKLYTRIRQWAHQGDLQAIRRIGREYTWSEEESRYVMEPREVGNARYRFGEALDLVTVRTRAADKTRAS